MLLQLEIGVRINVLFGRAFNQSYAVRKFRYLQNNGTSLWNFVLNTGLRQFSQQYINYQKVLSI